MNRVCRVSQILRLPDLARKHKRLLQIYENSPPIAKENREVLLSIICRANNLQETSRTFQSEVRWILITLKIYPKCQQSFPLAESVQRIDIGCRR